MLAMVDNGRHAGALGLLPRSASFHPLQRCRGPLRRRVASLGAPEEEVLPVPPQRLHPPHLGLARHE